MINTTRVPASDHTPSCPLIAWISAVRTHASILGSRWQAMLVRNVVAISLATDDINSVRPWLLTGSGLFAQRPLWPLYHNFLAKRRAFLSFGSLDMKQTRPMMDTSPGYVTRSLGLSIKLFSSRWTSALSCFHVSQSDPTCSKVHIEYVHVSYSSTLATSMFSLRTTLVVAIFLSLVDATRSSVPTRTFDEKCCLLVLGRSSRIHAASTRSRIRWTHIVRQY